MSAVGVIRVATWNVHACVGLDGRFDPERCASVVGELRAEVVALQEVDARRVTRPGFLDQFTFFAERTGLTLIRGAAFHSPDGAYGNALLTSLEVISAETVDLSVPGREPRGAIDARLAVGSVRLRVLATHLGLRRFERARQLRELSSRIDAEPASATVLLGDLNEWNPRHRMLGGLATRLTRAQASASFPSRRRMFALDQIWLRPGDALVDAGAHLSPAHRLASDHVPVYGTLDLARLAAWRSRLAGDL